jgi:putative transposase
MKQTIIYKLNPTKEQEGHLHNLCSIATKLYNTDNYQRRKVWEETGKIPNVYFQKKKLKENHWFKLLPSQTAQEMIFNLQRNYNSWFKLRKKDKEANPPGFRKKEMLSPITFYQQFKIVKDKIILSVSKKYKEEKGVKSLEIDLDLWKENQGIAKMCQIVFNKGEWFVHVVFDIKEPKQKLNDKIMAVDIGVINTAVTRDNQGNSTIYKGGELLSVQRYFNKTISKLQSTLTKQYPKRHSSNALKKLWEKRNNQMNQMLHTISKKIVDEAKKNDVKTIVVGDITDIRKDKHWRKKSSQKLHSWSFSKLTRQIEFKALQSGIRFVRVNEKDTSKTCSVCGTIRKNNRIKRGLYKCKICGRSENADINGATNILKKYLQFFQEDRSSGCVVQPKVSMIKNVLSR